MRNLLRPRRLRDMVLITSTVCQSSTITIQIFDNKKFKKRDQGLPLLIITIVPATLLLFFKVFWGLSVCQAQKPYLTQWRAVQVRYPSSS
jgi:hypothetical protein